MFQPPPQREIMSQPGRPGRPNGEWNYAKSLSSGQWRDFATDRNHSRAANIWRLRMTTQVASRQGGRCAARKKAKGRDTVRDAPLPAQYAIWSMVRKYGFVGRLGPTVREPPIKPSPFCRSSRATFSNSRR
jgi:hypothetical protein